MVPRRLHDKTGAIRAGSEQGSLAEMRPLDVISPSLSLLPVTAIYGADEGQKES